MVHAGPDSSAVGLASYITRSVGENGVTGQVFDFEERSEDLRASGTVLPSRLRDREPEFAHDVARLWSEAERAELIGDGTRFRSGAQLAKTQILALPNELTLEENVELVERWIERTWADHGAVVTWAIHEPEKGETNWHAHLLISTRELTEDGFGRKLRELNPTFSRGSYVRGRHDGCDRWREMQNEFFRERGLDAKVDPQRVVARRRFERQFYAEDLHKWREREDRAVRRPDRIIECLTRHQDCFTVRDVDRVLIRGNVPPRERDRLREEVLGRALALAGRDGERNGYFTSREARREAEQVRSAARGLAGPAPDRKLSHDRVVGAIARVEERAGIRFDFEQDQAIKHACRNRLSIWRGVAGSGKSVALEAVVEAHVRAGYQVIAASPTNTVAVDLRKTIADAPVNQQRRGREDESLGDARTLHSLEWQIGHGRMALDSRTILIVDEAGMVSTGMYAKVLREVENSGAKLLLVGDDRQLGSIERGGMFRVFVDDLGQENVRELERVRRQVDGWQREATVALAAGRFEDAIRAYSEHGSITFESTLERARERLIDDWLEDVQTEPEATRFVYAQTNAEVARINEGIQGQLEDSGRLMVEREYDTTRRDVQTVTRLGTGDRVQLFGTDKSKGLINGYCGTVTRCELDRIAMKLDNGKSVEWNPKQFRTFGLGYAGTVYRGQGKTQLRAYSLHTPMADRNTGMVALTRHREQLKVYAGRNVTPDEKALARQVARYVERGSSLAYEVYGAGRGKEPKARRETPVKQERPVVPGREHAPPRAAGNSAPEPGRGPTAPTVERPTGERAPAPTNPGRRVVGRRVQPPPGRDASKPVAPEPGRTPGRTGASTVPSPPSPSGRQTPGAPGRTPSPGHASRSTTPEPARIPGIAGAADPPSPSHQQAPPVPGRRHVPPPPDLSRLIPKFERELDRERSVGVVRPPRDDDPRRETLTTRVRSDIAKEMAATRSSEERTGLARLFEGVKEYVTTEADWKFLNQHEKLDAKTIVHAVGLRDGLTDIRTTEDRVPYLPMDRELKSISETLGRAVSGSDPGTQPSRQEAQSDVLRALEARSARLSDRIGQAERDAGLIARATFQVARDEKRELRELRYKAADIEHGRGGEGQEMVENVLRTRTADWHMHRDIHNGHVRALNEVEAIRAMPLEARGRAAEGLARSLERSGMREEGGRLREAVERRPADPPRAAEPTRERERTKEPKIERDRDGGYDRSR